MKLAILLLLFLACLEAIQADVKYECRPVEILDVNTSETVKEISDTKIALMLTVSKAKIFDGTYSYTFEKTDKDNYEGSRIYKNYATGRSITFPNKPLKNFKEVAVFYMMYGDPQTTVAMFFNCYDFEQVKAYRAKLKKQKDVIDGSIDAQGLDL